MITLCVTWSTGIFSSFGFFSFHCSFTVCQKVAENILYATKSKSTHGDSFLPFQSATLGEKLLCLPPFESSDVEKAQGELKLVVRVISC